MARISIDKATARAKLEPRSAPYWGAPLAPGLALGYRYTTAGRPGAWVARARSDDRKHVFESFGPASPANDYEAARQAALAWHRQLHAGVDSSIIGTVAEACADYVEALRRAKREKAADDAARRFERMIDSDPLGAVRLQNLRQRQIEAWRARMESGEFAPLPVKRGRPPVARPMTASAFKRNLTVLKAALNHAVARRYVGAEKAIEWESIKPERGADGRRELYLDREQRYALLDAAAGDLRDLIECVALTGCRPGDPAAMLRRDFDHRTGAVTFSTKDHRRTIEVTPKARALLTRLASGKKPNEAMFTNAGRRWEPADWSAQLRAAADAAGLPQEAVLYTLRHCWITDAIVGGVDLLTVARLSGTSVAMIQKHYGHLVPSAARDKLAALEL